MKVEDTTRSDGLRIISCNIPGAKKTFMEINVGAGSAFDQSDKEGQAHYAEHMAFKGTKTKSLADLQSISRRLRMRNAYTEVLRTGYMAEAPYTKFELLCEFLCDIVVHPSFPEDELETEKEVVANEIARDNDDDELTAYIGAWKNLWRANPLRIFGVGTPKGLGEISRHDLLSAHTYWYIPSNMVIVAAGKVNHEELLAQVNARIPLDDRRIAKDSWDDEYNIAPLEKNVVIKVPKRQKTTLLFACKFPKYTDERTSMTVRLMSLMLADDQALLWDELREKRGLIYGINGGIVTEPELGNYWYISTECLPRDAKEVRKIVHDTLYTPFKHETLFKEIKEQSDDMLVVGYESPSGWAHAILQMVRLGKDPKKTLKGYFPRHRKILADITLADLEALRARTLQPERFVTVTVK